MSRDAPAQLLPRMNRIAMPLQMRHALDRRLARWLLMAHDRVNDGELPPAQEPIAMIPGDAA